MFQVAKQGPVRINFTRASFRFFKPSPKFLRGKIIQKPISKLISTKPLEERIFTNAPKSPDYFTAKVLFVGILCAVAASITLYSISVLLEQTWNNFLGSADSAIRSTYRLPFRP